MSVDITIWHPEIVGSPCPLTLHHTTRLMNRREKDCQWNTITKFLTECRVEKEKTDKEMWLQKVNSTK